MRNDFHPRLWLFPFVFILFFGLMLYVAVQEHRAVRAHIERGECCTLEEHGQACSWTSTGRNSGYMTCSPTRECVRWAPRAVARYQCTDYGE